MSAGEGAALETIAQRLAVHAAERPGDTAFRFVGRHAGDARSVTWGDLHGEALGIAGALAGHVARPVLVLCPDPRDFVAGLAGCLLAGAVAVPVPGTATRRAAARIRSIAEAARPGAVLAPEATLRQPWLVELAAGLGIVPLALEALRGTPAAAPAAPPVAADRPALMQFTSGSTGTPRGVLLSAGNLAANAAAIVGAYDLGAATRGFSWLPLHHDMGLVGHILTPFWIGCRSTIMDPLLFLQSPLRWLRRVGEERATITSAPNFAYQLCIKAAADADLSDIDLSSLTAAVCGGEPVWPETAEAFCTRFAGCGFDPGAFAPSYGLAEATLLVSSGRRPGGPLPFAGEVRDPEAPGGRSMVRAMRLGAPVSGVSVRIVDAEGRTVPGDCIGEIEISGASVGRPAAGDAGEPSDRALTGDLGFLHDGELVVTGRRKELMILRGANVYPADAEAAAIAADPLVSPAGVAAFGVVTDGTEEMFVAFEVRTAMTPEAFDAVARRLNDAVGRATGHVPAVVLAVPMGALPRTTSGKIRRHELGTLCARRALDVHNATDHSFIPNRSSSGGSRH